jgi:hypothetical protein
MITEEIIAFGYANDRLWLKQEGDKVCVCVGHDWASIPIAEGEKTVYVATHTQDEILDRILTVLQEQTDPIVKGYIGRALYASARYDVCIRTSGIINISVDADGIEDAKAIALFGVKNKRFPPNLTQHMEVVYARRIDK